MVTPLPLFGPSPQPFLYPHSSKLDGVTRTLHGCLKYQIEACEKNCNMLTSVDLHFVFGAGSRKCLIELIWRKSWFNLFRVLT
jgi:hypothetical protein